MEWVVERGGGRVWSVKDGEVGGKGRLRESVRCISSSNNILPTTTTTYHNINNDNTNNNKTTQQQQHQ